MLCHDCTVLTIHLFLCIFYQHIHIIIISYCTKEIPVIICIFLFVFTPAFYTSLLLFLIMSLLTSAAN